MGMDDDILRVIKDQDERIDALRRGEMPKRSLDAEGLTWEKMLRELPPEIRNARITLEDIATPEEIAANTRECRRMRENYKHLYRLDGYDYAAAGIVGTIAALLDFFLVTKVDVKTGNVCAGKMKSGVEKLWDKILPASTARKLEKANPVCFDISVNTMGLNPKTHRFQSLGHDPIMGFLFGVKDQMCGELTVIDGSGRLIVQKVSGAVEKNFLEAFITEVGHLLSDVNAMSPGGKTLSVPAPFMPLLQMIQAGCYEYKGKTYTIGDLSKKMYRDGYNFNHFVGMCVPVLFNNIMIRLYVALREMFSDNYEGKNKKDMLLLVTSSILFAENAGKVVVTKNPFAINYAAWTDMAKHTMKGLKYVCVDRPSEIGYVQKQLDDEWEKIYEMALEAQKVITF
ncbi:MAG: hypothetical protein LIO86_12110 [Lachnospiraceae bacterium]|nr:hypothetical protein [Lachnospiraceae bacterium]